MSANANSHATHCARIRAWLEAGNTLTPLEALDKWGCFRLGARIWELIEKQGLSIGKTMVRVTSERTGRPCRVAQYFLEPATANESPNHAT